MHELLVRHTRFISAASAPGRLYDAGWYPAAMPPGSDGEMIRGEVYALRPGGMALLLAALDHYENYLPDRRQKSLFVRTVVEVSIPVLGPVCAWIYLFNRAVHHLPRIDSGDFASYAAARERRGEGR